MAGIQENNSKIRNRHITRLREIELSIRQTGKQQVYGYDSLAIKEKYEESLKLRDVPVFDIQYQPDPFRYQYDLEVFLFLYYDELKQREVELANFSEKSRILKYGATGFERYEHLLNAMAIRWPTVTLPNGQKSGVLLRTEWLEDVAKGFSLRPDSVSYGGAGQGKTYGFLAFMCIIFDYFYFTKSGAQCSYSTVTEHKIKASTWPYVNKLYGGNVTGRPPYSLSAGLAKKCADYTFKRTNLQGKVIDEGGNFIGVLLQKGIKDSRTIDKLTGCHDPIARCYLLDEAQATDDAPLNAYTNMFLHPKWGWFNMAGNFETDGDLLGVNVRPNVGWENINETTHIYEGTLRSTKQNLGRTTYVIHFNNELSPAMKNPELAKVYPHLPNKAKKEKLYPTEESKRSYGHKRFWIGYRFEKERGSQTKILTSKLLEDSRAAESPDWAFEPICISSFDSAPASVDRNAKVVFKLGLDAKTGFPIIAPEKVFCFPKPDSELKYYDETIKNFLMVTSNYNIASGHSIQDWTARTALIEMLADKGFICHHLIYQEAVPKKQQLNKITKSYENPIELETLKTFAGTFEKKVTYYAHEKINNRISLGAYLLRYFVEKGCFRNFNSNILVGVPEHNGFDQEFLQRSFITLPNGLITVDSKEKFKDEHGFSPDIMDNFFQIAYLMYVLKGIRYNKKSLGTFKREKDKNVIDKLKKSRTFPASLKF